MGRRTLGVCPGVGGANDDRRVVTDVQPARRNADEHGGGEPESSRGEDESRAQEVPLRAAPAVAKGDGIHAGSTFFAASGRIRPLVLLAIFDLRVPSLR